MQRKRATPSAIRNLAFTVSARTARLIGRENVANAEGAIIELVKNCYDADSKHAIVWFDLPNDSLIILDSGTGMTEDVIVDQWMTIGTDEKLSSPVTNGGRVKAGAKGIGRFALDRLGEKCDMVTFAKPANSRVSRGILWSVDWSAFEEKKKGRSKNIDEVFATISPLNGTTLQKEIVSLIKDKRVRAIVTKSDFITGTLLRITGLRDKWDNDYINRLYENLELLTPPEGQNRMPIWLYDATEEEKYGLVETSNYQDYDYRISAHYDPIKSSKIAIDFHRNEFDITLIDKRLFTQEDMKLFPFDQKTFKKEKFTLSLDLDEIIRGFKDPEHLLAGIGGFEFVLYFLKNRFDEEGREKFKYKSFLGDRSAWLRRFGGVKMYRDNFRIRPYGEAGTEGYDWLSLGERHGLSPAAVSRKGGWRVRANQVAGVVKFSRLTNPFLEDKSNREGLQENKTFALFRNILLGIIKVMEDDRSTVAANLLELYAKVNEEEQAIEESNAIADTPTEENESQAETKKKNRTLRTGFIAQRSALQQKNDEVIMSRAMATAGIMVASFSHEFHGIRNDLVTRADDLISLLKPVLDNSKLKSLPASKDPLFHLKELKKEDVRIKQWIDFAIGLTQRDRRKVKSVSVVDYLLAYNDNWANLLRERGIELSILYNKANRNQFIAKITELDLDTIFDNLLVNSIEAFQLNSFNGEKKITINATLLEERIKLVYSDSGPGLDKAYKKPQDIFKAFETTKKDDQGNDIGTGLGMWLVKSAVDSNRGSITIDRPKAGFQVTINIKREKQKQ